MARARTTDKLTDFGKKYMAQMKKLEARPYVKNGFLQRDFERPHKGSKATVGEVAVFNEFGTSTAPERSFIRSTWDAHASNKATWAGYADELKKAINEGKLTVTRALARMGARIKSDTQEKIRSNVPPPNAPSTLKAKFPKDKTLINTGQMLNALDFEVHDRLGDD